MEEIVAKGNENLLILHFDPSDLVNNLVTPLVEALVTNFHVAVEHPEEAEAFFL